MLFLALRAWRRETANEKGVPACVILHDSTLREISARRPATLAELGEIWRLGTKKLGAYGEAVWRWWRRADWCRAQSAYE